MSKDTTIKTEDVKKLFEDAKLTDLQKLLSTSNEQKVAALIQKNKTIATEFFKDVKSAEQFAFLIQTGVLKSDKEIAEINVKVDAFKSASNQTDLFKAVGIEKIEDTKIYTDMYAAIYREALARDTKDAKSAKPVLDFYSKVKESKDATEFEGNVIENRFNQFAASQKSIFGRHPYLTAIAVVTAVVALAALPFIVSTAAASYIGWTGLAATLTSTLPLAVARTCGSYALSVTTAAVGATFVGLGALYNWFTGEKTTPAPAPAKGTPAPAPATVGSVSAPSTNHAQQYQKSQNQAQGASVGAS